MIKADIVPGYAMQREDILTWRGRPIVDLDFVDYVLGLDIDNPISFMAFIQRYGPWIISSKTPYVVFFLDEPGKAELLEFQRLVAPEVKESQQLVMEAYEMLRPFIGKDLRNMDVKKRAAFKEALENLNEALRERTEFSVRAVEIDDKGEGIVGFHPEVRGRDLAGTALLCLLQKLVMGKTVHSRSLICAICGKPIPKERRRSNFCSKKCSNVNSARKDERRYAAILRQRFLRRKGWDYDQTGEFSRDLSLALKSKDAIETLRKVEKKYGLAPRKPGRPRGSTASKRGGKQ